MLRFWSVSDLEFFLRECYGFREMAEEHEDEMLRFQVSGEWVFSFRGMNGFSVSGKWVFSFRGMNGFSVSGEWVFLRFSSWMLGKNIRMKTTRAVGEEHDLGLLGFHFVSRCR